MRTSLWSIARKAKRDTQYRFLNLYTMLNKVNLFDCWRYIKKNAASGVDQESARDFEEELEGNIDRVVEDLKQKRYRAKSVRRQYIPKRLGKFDLSLSEEKTRVIRFSRFYAYNGKRFDYLGFEFRWGLSRAGRFPGCSANSMTCAQKAGWH